MALNSKNNEFKASFEELCISNLESGIKPTKAVEKALKDYNSVRSVKDGLCLRQAWRRYGKIKGRKIKGN